MTGWGERGRGTGWLVVAGVAGAVLLAMVGAPLSVDLIFLVGPDQPLVIGEQFAVLFCGAAATAAGILLANRWRWLLVGGAVAMLVAQAIRVPRPRGLTVRVAPSGRPGPEPDLTAHPVWLCLLVVAAALLLTGVLAVARELLRDNVIGATVAGFAGCAGYCGAMIVGRLRTADAALQVAIVAIVAAVTVLAVTRLRTRADPPAHPLGSWARLLAAGAALMWLLPTLIVAIRGTELFGTVIGGIVGLVCLGVAVLASRPAGTAGMLAVAATGLVLAAPLVMLTLVYDVLIGGVWYAWPLALAGMLAGSAAAAGPWPLRAGVVAAAALAMVGLTDDVRADGALVIWIFLVTTAAAVATTVGSAANTLSTVDATAGLGALGTLAGLGVFGSLNLLRVGAGGRADLHKVLGGTLAWTSVAMLAAAAALLLAVSRSGPARVPWRTSVVRSGRSATGRVRRSR